LPAAAEEIALLRSLQSPGATFVHLPARRRKLHEAFEQGGFDLLHLACHGIFGGSASADGSAVLLEDGTFRAAELSPRMAGALRREAPLIFFNACHSGRLGFSPTGLGSGGARLVQLGCGGFIGSLWPVTDTAALTFARAFYGALMRGCAIGEAMAEARQVVRQGHPGDPTWLAYCCFADPMAHFERSERDDSSTGESTAISGSSPCAKRSGRRAK
jgi:CHAT domain-containing protein